jgi:RNA polymerase sigma-70 factor (ECF subfamily)
VTERADAHGSDATELFEAQRRYLVGVAYRVLGSVSDAEDVVQDAWLRWSRVNIDSVEDPRSFLVTVSTRLAIDRLRRRQAAIEGQPGTWLPEPMAEAADDPVELAESVSFGLLLVLESLSPLERAVFVLHEAFGYSYAEIATFVERQEAAVRQLGHRARTHVKGQRARYETDPATHREVVERFHLAVQLGDIGALLSVLAPDVILVADGGGKVRAPLLPVVGIEKVVRFLGSVASRPLPSQHSDVEIINGSAGIVVRSADGPAAALSFDVDDGTIRAVFLVGDPDKLQRL